MTTPATPAEPPAALPGAPAPDAIAAPDWGPGPPPGPGALRGPGSYYVTVAGPTGLKRVVRADGLPLGTRASAAPRPAAQVSGPAVSAVASFVASARADLLRRRTARRGRRRGGPVPDG